jgi:hypothetical protein
VLTAAAGLSALVAFTGAAIVWVRFEEAKLPAEQAVGVTPEPTLVTVGGAALGAFALIAGLAVLIVYLVDSQGTRARQSALVLLLAGTGVALATLFADASGSAHLIAISVTAVATLAAIGLAAIALDTPRKAWVCEHQWHLLWAGEAAVAAAVVFLLVVLQERLAAGALAIVAIVLTGLLALAFKSDDDLKKENPELFDKLVDSAGDIIRFLAAPAALALLALVLYLVLNAWWIAILVLLAAALVIGVLTVAHRTDSKFAWYGTAVFVAVVVFGATMHALRTLDVPRLQPMAILFTDQAGGGGQSGLFVSQTSDRVYLGLVERCHRNPRDLVLRPGPVKSGTGQIVSVPRSQIAAESVGTMGELNEALERAPKLLNELGKRFTPVGGEPPPLPVHPCENEGVIDQKERTTSPVPTARAEQLAATFRPILKFDSKERWRPINIDHLLTETDAQGQPAHRLCDGVMEDALHCSAITVASQIAAAPNDPKAFVNLAGVRFGGKDHRSPTLSRCPSQDGTLQDCDRGPASAIYYHVVAANDRYYIDYWWFLRYNRFERQGASELCRSVLTRSKQCFDHEGDWEGVTVVAFQSRPKQLAFVHYAAHEGVFRYTPKQIEHEGARPIVYIARGSHAAYPAKCENNCRQVAELFGHALPEDNADGRASWGRNGDAACKAQSSCLQALPTASWGPFAGFWGSRTCDDGDGACRFGVPPRTPARQRRFTSPWCYSGVGLRLVCDGQLPTTKRQ